MTNFLLALQFLTVIPLEIKNLDGKKLAHSLVYFPLVGLLIGLVLSGLSSLLSALHFYEFTASVIIVVALAVITGGMHLDGLADTFDGLMGGRSREKCLEIMRDPHAGAMGVISIVCALLLKISLIFSFLPQDRGLALVMMGVCSRFSLVEAMFFFPYARSEGKAKVFIANINRKIFFIAAGITVFLSVVVWQIKGILILFTATAIAWLVGKAISRKLGGITGDVLGAINELIEVIVLGGVLIMGRIG